MEALILAPATVKCGRLLRHRTQKLVPWYDKGLNSGGEYVKSSSTLAVSVPIILIIKLGFVYVNGPRETWLTLLKRCVDVQLLITRLYVKGLD